MPPIVLPPIVLPPVVLPPVVPPPFAVPPIVTPSLKRPARVHSDGRVQFEALIKGGKSAYHWECFCRPEDGHHHAAQHKKLAKGLEVRDTLIDGLNGLVGEGGRVGLLRYKITDCNIQIHGPEKWVLYVAWEEEVPSGVGTAFRHWTHEMKSLETSPPPTVEAVLGKIRADVAINGNGVAAAIRAAGEFNSA